MFRVSGDAPHVGWRMSGALLNHSGVAYVCMAEVRHAGGWGRGVHGCSGSGD